MYQRILIATDLTEEALASALAQARAVANAQARLTLLHVIEPQTIPYSIDPAMTGSRYEEREAGQLQKVRAHLAAQCESLDFKTDDIAVAIGRPAAEIHHLAKELNCDLIAIASHGRHGWQRLLGSTANAVLHGAPCDILVSRLPEA
ncbi:MAG: universal stress protein [Pseudomonadales bacterium]